MINRFDHDSIQRGIGSLLAIITTDTTIIGRCVVCRKKTYIFTIQEEYPSRSTLLWRQHSPNFKNVSSWLWRVINGINICTMVQCGGIFFYTIGTNKCTMKAWYKYLYQFRMSSLFSDNPVLKSSKGILNCAHLGGILR